MGIHQQSKIREAIIHESSQAADSPITVLKWYYPGVISNRHVFDVDYVSPYLPRYFDRDVNVVQLDLDYGDLSISEVKTLILDAPERITLKDSPRIPDF